MMEEHNELKNRFMVVNSPEEWEKDTLPTSTRQVPDKYPTSSFAVRSLLQILYGNQLSIKEILVKIGLKNRENLLKNYLHPAINDGLVIMLYPNNPKHPKQKYLLTDKGMGVYQALYAENEL